MRFMYSSAKGHVTLSSEREKRRYKMSKDSKRGKYTRPEGSATWEYLAVTSCSLMIFSVGCIAGWNSPTLGILRSPDTPIVITSSDASTLSSMVALGHALAPSFTMVTGDKLGRKYCLLATGIPTIICWAMIGITQHIVVLFVARFFAGLAVGLIMCYPQMYLGEIASAKLRGALGMVCGTMLNTGILFMFVIVPLLSIKTMAIICLGISIVTVISVWFIPESPYFLAMVGKFEEAEAALEKLRGKTEVTEELELIKLTVGKKRRPANDSVDEGEHEVGERSSALKKLFTVAGNRKALFINFLFVVVMQFGSCISIMIYGQIIFDKMNTGVSTHVCMMIIASLQIVCNILTAFVIDKLGRKPLIGISGILSGACLLGIGVYFYLMEHTKTDVTPYGLFALFASLANIVALNIGLMPLQHVIQSEVLGTDIKELATCIIGVAGGLIAIVAIKLYLLLAESWGLGHCVPFFNFTTITWICTGLLLKVLPETKGKTLYEIQKDLNA